MSTHKDIERSLRPISWLDRLRAKLFKSPSTFGSHYCHFLSSELSTFIDSGAVVTKVCAHHMTIRGASGKEITIWCANYPHSYGNIERGGNPSGDYLNKYPSWEVILKLRKMQLEKRELVINKYIASHKL